jgi:hypothetical protein
MNSLPFRRQYPICLAEDETNIGQWVHLGQIVPTVHNFLSRLHFLKQRAEKRRKVDINEQCQEDLNFLLFFLQQCRDGIDQNLIAFRHPTHVYRSDSCPAGLGRPQQQRYAWRYYLPNNLKFQESNNLLEHLAVIINPWVGVLAARLNKGNCALSMTDSTTLEGLLRKTNFIEDGKDQIQATIRLEDACFHASQYLSNRI